MMGAQDAIGDARASAEPTAAEPCASAEYWVDMLLGIAPLSRALGKVSKTQKVSKECLAPARIEIFDFLLGFSKIPGDEKRILFK